MDPSTAEYYRCEFCNLYYTYAGALIKHVKKAHATTFPEWSTRRQRNRLVGTDSGFPRPIDRRLEADLELTFHDSDEEMISDSEQPSDVENPDPTDSALDAETGELTKTTKTTSGRENGKEWDYDEIPAEKRPRKATAFHHETPWAPFKTEADFELARWFIENNIGKGAIDGYFHLTKRFPEQFHGGSFKSAYTLLKAVDRMPMGLDPAGWKKGHVRMRLEEDITNEIKEGFHTSSDGYETFYLRDINKCIEHLAGQSRLNGDFIYEAIEERNEKNKRIYSEVHTGDWMMRMQQQTPVGSTILGLLLASDATHLSNFSGDHKLYPVYMTFTNIRERVRQRPNQHCNVLIALLPVPPKHSATGKGKTKKTKDQIALNREVQRSVMAALLNPLKDSMQTGVYLQCPDGRIHWCFPRIAGWIADHMENIVLHSVKSQSCVACELPRNQYGDLPAKRDILRRDGGLYLKHLRVLEDPASSQEARQVSGQFLESRDVKAIEGSFWSLHNPDYFDTRTLAVPDMLHTVYLGVLQHLMKWITAFLSDHGRLERFNQIWRQTPPYPGLKRFNKDYLAVSQWSGKEMRALGRILLPVLASTLRHPKKEEEEPFRKALRCTRYFIYLHLMLQYRSHDEDTLNYSRRYLKGFHQYKAVFMAHRAGKGAKKAGKELRKSLLKAKEDDRETDPVFQSLSATEKKKRMAADQEKVEEEVEKLVHGQTDFGFVKMHYLTCHFIDHIPEFGNLHSFAGELMESSHKTLKDGYRRSNKVNATEQILTYVNRHENFDLFRLNQEHECRVSIDMEEPAPIPHQLQGPQGLRKGAERIHKVSSLATQYQFDLQDLAKWIEAFLTLFHPAQSENLGHLLQAIPDWPVEVYNSLSFGRLEFGSADLEEKITVRCTGPRPWRGSEPPREDAVFINTGDAGLHGDLKGRLPAHLKALFKLKDPSGISYRLAVVRTYNPMKPAGGRQSAKPGEGNSDTGLVSVEILKNPPRTKRSPGCTYIVPIRRVVAPAHLIRFEVDDSNGGYYVNNTVDLETWNDVYINELKAL